MSAPLLMLDHDGVVVDSLEIFSSSFLLGCRREGLAAIATQDDMLRLFAGNVYESMRAAGADDEQIMRVVRGAADTMRVALPALHPFPLMPEVLGELAEARHVVVVTSNTEDSWWSTFLRRHGICGVAEIAGAEAGQSKVDKIRGLMARFPEQDVYWFVGDTAGDMREARLAGATPGRRRLGLARAGRARGGRRGAHRAGAGRPARHRGARALRRLPGLGLTRRRA